jgi:hypothetical protein
MTSSHSPFSIKKLFSSSGRPHPVRDWLLLLAAVLLLFVFGLVWNLYLFYQLESGKVIGSAVVPPPAAVASPQTSVTDVQHVFQERATEEGKYQKEYRFADPSLSGTSSSIPAAPSEPVATSSATTAAH